MNVSRLDRRDKVLLISGLLVASLIWVATQQISWMVIHPAFLSGYLLAVIAATQGLFTLRKRLPGLPIGAASTWLKLHVVGGLVLLPVFWLHLGKVWPNGLFEQGLACLFYLMILTGILGRLLQKALPIALATSGGEVNFERIPGDIIRLRHAVEQLLIDCAAETGKRSLALAYEQSLGWYFRRPRFLFSCFFGMARGRHWYNNQARVLERTLGADEQGYLEKMSALASKKHLLDLHYAQQGLLRYWLFLHTPIAVAFYVGVIWHIMLVHLYAQ
ncbi:MAG: hypothetical protein ACRBM6_28795 [Geminicoccales bacterium]